MLVLTAMLTCSHCAFLESIYINLRTFAYSVSAEWDRIGKIVGWQLQY
jgi:hypothetical protein